ncbi:hypothetical protein [Streptomyces sporangiiformans]|uniref:Uncharacterized protein n=1 Tax=Streptomyces sporangiiformans TaxID=2315329 RepID=A0A505DKH5_9ACTN|nr:hypothetical protein [Streptomyces sporangiiformans]TPQ20336.1 hypothetical protein FGD71_020905 [Streptomyces sporangiiformans]
MTRTGRKGNHRSRKKRITLVLAPVVAAAVAVPLMNQAGAATPSEVTKDCAENSAKLDNCEFVDVQNKRNSLGPNKRVSTVTDNCGSTTAATKNFSVSASVVRSVTLEDGFVAAADSKLGNSFFEVGAKFNTSEFNLERDDTGTGFDFSRTDTVKADHLGFFMWSEKRTDVSGFLRATYKEEQNGQKVFFSPEEGGTSVHVFYPQLLKNGTPDGRLWLRNVKCGTPEAGGIQNSSRSLRAEPGFEEGGENVSDVEIPLSEIPAP